MPPEIKPLKDLLIGIPARGQVSIHLIPLVTRWTLAGAGIMTSTHMLIENSRNIMAREFLKTGKQWLLMLDADTIPEVEGPEKLIKHNKDIIAGFYRLIQLDGSEGKGPPLVVTNAWGVTEGSKGLQECGRVATGYLLIHRKVFEKIKEPWFYVEWLDKKHYEFLTEDYAFSEKAKRAGFKLWCDLDVKAKHAKTILLE